MGGFALVGFTTDYGLRDAYVGVCHGVLARFAPAARVVDVTHLVPPQDVRHGAAVLAAAVPWFPPAVHLAVVDPGVGTARRAVAVEAGGSVLVGPDNGLLPAAADALGGADRAVELTVTSAFLTPVSRTFHGRDVFAPCAGRIAAGTPATALGGEIDPAGLVRLPVPRLLVVPGTVTAEIAYVDGFGNLQLAAGPEHLRAAGLAGPGDLEVRVGARTAAVRHVGAFGEVPAGDLLLYEESSGRLEVAANQDRAAVRLDAAAGDLLTVGRPRPVRPTPSWS